MDENFVGKHNTNKFTSFLFYWLIDHCAGNRTQGIFTRSYWRTLPALMSSPSYLLPLHSTRKMNIMCDGSSCWLEWEWNQLKGSPLGRTVGHFLEGLMGWEDPPLSGQVPPPLSLSLSFPCWSYHSSLPLIWLSCPSKVDKASGDSGNLPDLQN